MVELVGDVGSIMVIIKHVFVLLDLYCAKLIFILQSMVTKAELGRAHLQYMYFADGIKTVQEEASPRASLDHYVSPWESQAYLKVIILLVHTIVIIYSPRLRYI